MKLFLLTVLFCLSLFSFGQDYLLKGTVTNESNQTVEAVTCILQNIDDTLYMKTVITDAAGRFEFDGIKSGSYRLKLQHLAYESDEHSIIVNSDDELPPFVLRSLSKDLNEIVVSGERPVVKADAGKLIYDVPQLIRNKAVSNAYESLQNVPGVIGTGDNLQLVGSSEYTILINGQQTSMSKEQLIGLLKTMPASRVGNIEIMYSAPPQYNIRGAAINVILKDQSEGVPVLQGEGNMEYRQAFYAGYGARANLIYTKPSFNADLTVGVDKSKGWGDSHMFAIHHFDGHKYDITQDNRSKNDSRDLNIRLGLGYTFKNKDKLRLVYTGNIGDSESIPSSKTVFLQDENPYSNIRSYSEKSGDDNLHNLKLEYNSHKKLNIGADYTFYNDPATERYYDYSEENVLQRTFKTETGQRINKAVLFANHTVALPSKWNLNYGANFTVSGNNNKYDYYRTPESATVDSVNNTKQKEYSGSVFAGFTKTFGAKLSAQASVSLNYYRATIDIMGDRKTLWNDFQPFVNANLTYTHNPDRILQFSFSSDIDYPPYWALSTDRFQINAYSLAEGNPELKFSRKYKSQLVFIMKRKYMAGAFFEHVPDRYIQLPYQSQDRLENVFQMVNLDYARQYGMFFIVPFAIEKVWDAKVTLNLMRQEQKKDDFYDTPFNRSMNTFVVNMSNTFNISSKPNIKLDVSAFYMYGAIQGIYDIGQMWNMDTGLKWTSSDNRIELMLRGQDIFKIGKQTTKIDYMNQYNTMRINPNAPALKLSFTYRFGNYKKAKIEEVDTSRFGR